jgi:hypothetical protein
MKNTIVLALLAALAVLGASLNPLCAAENGVAVAIVYDTSGSMKDAVRDASGKSTPKYVIANRALAAVASQIEAFATNGARRVDAGLFVFGGETARAAVPFGPFNAEALKDFAKKFANPNGNTPLGNSLTVAAKTLLNSPLSRKHILVITDGMNTAGPQPSAVMPRIQKDAQAKQTALSVHFVAFDVAASTFDPVKKQGATVVGAEDEKQLNTQLNFILQEKILLEDEEPKK